MGDVFVEKIVRRFKTVKDYLIIAGLLFAAFVLITALFMFAQFIGIFMPVLLIALIYGLWYLLMAQNKEFEYIVTNGELDIDLIIARRKRKRVFSGQAKGFELLDRCDSAEFSSARRGNPVVLDFSSRPGSEQNYFLLTQYKNKRTMVIFTPDERILTHLKRYNPSKIKFTPQNR